MTKDKFANIMKDAFAAYGRDLDTDSGRRLMASWYEIFGSSEPDELQIALKRHVMNKNTQPKVSDIRELISPGQGQRNTHACPSCGQEAKQLIRLGPNTPQTVCAECWDQQHGKVDEVHARAARVMGMDKDEYIASLPRNREEFMMYAQAMADQAIKERRSSIWTSIPKLLGIEPEKS
jgi:hypothetical protein